MTKQVRALFTVLVVAFAASSLAGCFRQGPSLPPDEECQRFHEGKFVLPGQEDGLVIERKGATQTETKGEKTLEYKVHWLKPCIYDLYTPANGVVGAEGAQGGRIHAFDRAESANRHEDRRRHIAARRSQQPGASARIRVGAVKLEIEPLRHEMNIASP